MPLLPKREIETFLREVAPQFAESLETDIIPLPKKALTAYVMPTAIFFALLSGVTGYFYVWGWYGLLLSVGACLLGLWRFRDGGWKLHGGMLLLRYRQISRTTLLVPRGRIQSCDVYHNPWQRRRGTSTFGVAVASSMVGSRFRLSGLLIEESRMLLAWFRRSG